MADNSEDRDQIPNFDVPWLERWIAADFSWSGLEARGSWIAGQGGTLQQFLRAMENQASDAELLQRGILIDCGEHGIFHVLFVPEEWADSQPAKISAADLLAAKQRYWHGLFTTGPIRDGGHATLSGVHLPLDIERRLSATARASFEWVRFHAELRNIPRRGDRSFTWCLFNEPLHFYGRANSEGGECTVHFTWCEFAKAIIAERVSNLDSLEINGSALRERLEISDSELETMRLDYCNTKSLSITDRALNYRKFDARMD